MNAKVYTIYTVKLYKMNTAVQYEILWFWTILQQLAVSLHFSTEGQEGMSTLETGYIFSLEQQFQWCKNLQISHNH